MTQREVFANFLRDKMVPSFALDTPSSPSEEFVHRPVRASVHRRATEERVFSWSVTQGRIRLRCRTGRWHDDVSIYDGIAGPLGVRSRCATRVHVGTDACMCKHTGAMEACNEPRVT